ncbi:hypothetical protein GCK72_021922 [Caenorhabditis remanei]|uniref:SAM domain-containing protein n=1 Tax=Caenorhabditis remanei TaxID=31234 RepID=A0A6A5GL28_CAERE|nr:hypothetical protein GCK72_021922 [Caenorhabditis remanei]KAF1755353.1 hypothetical protein GCK72_021922 [Caenorhabditis remanei]
MEAWTQFFIRAGIPKEIAQKYAKSFHNNRITKEMLPELDKSTLSELGVTAIGDQLCILRRIKAAKSAIERGNDDMDEVEAPKTAPKARITAPNSEFSTIPDHRRGKPPPDRHEIYHVKMPVGNTHRTREIMQKAEQMREQGLAVRGTTGVRQGGRSVSPIDKSSLAARMYRKQLPEVSSSTDRRKIGTKIERIAPSRIKKTITNRPSLSSRLTSSSAATPSGSLRISVDPNGKKTTSRIEGRLQKIVLPVRNPPTEVYVGGGDVEEYEMEEEEEVLDYEDDEMPYEEELIEEEYDDVVTVAPVRERISYSSSSNRMASTVQRAPAPQQSRHQSSSHGSSSSYRTHRPQLRVVEMSPPPEREQPTVFDRISRVPFNSRR